jgi:hypothetical protein
VSAVIWLIRAGEMSCWAALAIHAWTIVVGSVGSPKVKFVPKPLVAAWKTIVYRINAFSIGKGIG